jgi:polysaccharide export outer membrane protein
MRVYLPLLIVVVLYASQAAAQTSSQIQSRTNSMVANNGQTLSPSDSIRARQPDISCVDTPKFDERYPRVALHAGDTFDLVFTYSTEFNQTLTIQPDGYVSLQEAGDLHIDGMTAPEIAEAIRKQYSRILRDPSVAVIPKDVEKPYFIFSGEVKNPGKYELRARTTLTQSVALAGGFTDASKHSEVYLYRWRCGQAVQVAKVNVKKMFKTADLREDIELQPGDMIFVGQNAMSKFKSFIRPTAGFVVRVPY